MPRTLPWEVKGTSSTVTQSKRSISAASSVIQKKPRVQSATPDSTRNRSSASRKESIAISDNGIPPSSSPPPEPPEERFMIEGVDNDDKYRMVEDEFLAIAQNFTAHLHAAEYKRQQKMVKSRNAETINSISRPVTARMPDSTRRKVEGVARMKKQHTAIDGLLVKTKDRGAISDSDDDVGLPYIGTSLHGLMDSPRKKMASLSKVIPIRASTRAAAGFNKPATNTKSNRRQLTASPQPKSAARRVSVKEETVSDTSGNEDDDDLDTPIPALKLVPKARQVATLTTSSSEFPSFDETVAPKPSIKVKTNVSGQVAPTKHLGSLDFDDLPGFQAQARSHTSRVRARQLRAKQEQAEKKLDEIPDFL